MSQSFHFTMQCNQCPEPHYPQNNVRDIPNVQFCMPSYAPKPGHDHVINSIQTRKHDQIRCSPACCNYLQCWKSNWKDEMELLEIGEECGDARKNLDMAETSYLVSVNFWTTSTSILSTTSATSSIATTSKESSAASTISSSSTAAVWSTLLLLLLIAVRTSISLDLVEAIVAVCCRRCRLLLLHC